MSMSDPIADFLTRIRNAQRAGHRWVDCPSSKLKVNIALLLKLEGYIRDFVIIDEGPQGILRLYLKYDVNGKPVIEGITRVSRPGRRRYVNARNIPRVHKGLGIAILSTSRGVITDKQARRENVGGELLCYVW